MKKRLTAAAAAVLAVLVTAGAALALTTHQPTLTLDAHREGRRIDAKGVYDSVSPVCKGPGGRSVVVYGNGAQIASGTTRGSGRYSAESGRLKKGKYTVQSFVAGSVRGGYADTDVCLDAWSNTDTVRIRGGGGGGDDDDDH